MKLSWASKSRPAPSASAIAAPETLPPSPSVVNNENPNLDLLRTLAVFYVMGFHLLLFFRKGDLGSLWAIGRWGVLLFFVHTSLVLMFSLERQEQKLAAANIFWPFYLRRIFRILPLSMLVVCVVTVSSMPVGHLSGGEFRAVHLTTSGFIANLCLVQNLTGTDSVTAPLWSLPYEVQMYLLLPLFYLFVRGPGNFGRSVGIWLISVLLAGAGYRIFHVPYPSFILFVPCFAAGVVSYKMSRAASFKLPFIIYPLMIALVTYMYVRSPSTPRSWLWCLAVGLSIPFFADMPYPWLKKSCQTVARYSYGIYLIHFACIWFAFVVLANEPMLIRWLVFATTVAAIPAILYHTVEAPMISLGHRMVNRLATTPGNL